MKGAAPKRTMPLRDCHDPVARTGSFRLHLLSKGRWLFSQTRGSPARLRSPPSPRWAGTASSQDWSRFRSPALIACVIARSASGAIIPFCLVAMYRLGLPRHATVAAARASGVAGMSFSFSREPAPQAGAAADLDKVTLGHERQSVVIESCRTDRAWRALAAHPEFRSDLNDARISSTKSCGCSHAAKWPPLSSLL